MIAPARSVVTQCLIDMVVSVKSTGKVADLEDVSEDSIQVSSHYHFQRDKQLEVEEYNLSDILDSVIPSLEITEI